MAESTTQNHGFGLMSKTTIEVQGLTIAVLSRNNQDYISLTDIARYRNAQEPFAIINNWMRTRSTIEFLGLWEKLSNPTFKPLEFERFKSEAGSNYFVLSPQLKPKCGAYSSRPFAA